MPTVLIAPAPLRNQEGSFREILRSAGFDDFIDPEGDNTLTQAQLAEVLPRCDAMLAGGELITAGLLDLAPRLRAIARTGVGYDAIDVPAATARKVPVVIVPGTNHESVAEHTFALLLALTRRVAMSDREVKSGGWPRTLLMPVRGKTLGLVGFGRIGRAVAVRAVAFGMTVVAYDPVSDPEAETRLGVTRLGLDDLLAASDFVSLHLPLSPQTRGLMNRETLARMRPGSLLINTSRGGLIVEPDLHASLTSGHLAGAGLDVLDPEPPGPGNPLVALPNVVVTPHLGGVDTRAMADMAELASSCIAALKQGRWPSGCVVNDELAPGWSW